MFSLSGQVSVAMETDATNQSGWLMEMLNYNPLLFFSTLRFCTTLQVKVDCLQFTLAVRVNPNFIGKFSSTNIYQEATKEGNSLLNCCPKFQSLFLLDNHAGDHEQEMETVASTFIQVREGCLCLSNLQKFKCRTKSGFLDSSFSEKRSADILTNVFCSLLPLFLVHGTGSMCVTC